MASLLDFLSTNGRPGGLLGNLQAQPQSDLSDFGHVGNFLSRNPLMLMALGGGIAQGGVGRGLAAAVPAAQYEQAQRRQGAVQGATYDALRSAGVPHGQALAGALNPVVLKTIAKSHFDAKPTSQSPVTPYQPPDMSSLDTVVGHLGNLMEASNKLNSNPLPVPPPAEVGSIRLRPLDSDELGQARVRAGEGKGGGDGYAAQKLALARNAVSDEMAKVLRTDGMSDEEIRSWTDSLGASNSPTELRAVIGRGVERMNSRLAALNAQYERALGRPAPAWLSPKSSAMLEKIRQWASEGSRE
jgi:hypothetical protein